MTMTIEKTIELFGDIKVTWEIIKELSIGKVSMYDSLIDSDSNETEFIQVLEVFLLDTLNNLNNKIEYLKAFVLDRDIPFTFHYEELEKTNTKTSPYRIIGYFNNERMNVEQFIELINEMSKFGSNEWATLGL